MDPNANLEYALRLARRVVGYVEDDMPIEDEDALFLAECVLNLDDWLSKKGFLPDKWARK